MRAELRRMHSPDIHDLKSWSPDGDFGILVQLLVGPENGPGEESFDVTLCTTGWLTERVQEVGLLDGRHHLLTEKYDFGQFESYVRERLSEFEGDNWEAVALQVGRLGRWEFEDYRT